MIEVVGGQGPKDIIILAVPSDDPAYEMVHAVVPHQAQEIGRCSEPVPHSFLSHFPALCSLSFPLSLPVFDRPLKGVCHCVCV